MEILENNKPTNFASQQQSGSLPIIDILFITLRHWPWILLSVVLCVGTAFFYLARKPNIYTRAAEIMVKDKSNSSALIDISDLGLGKSRGRTNMENEIANFRSNDLMEDVVKRLNLDVSCYRNGSLHRDLIYGSTLPVDIRFTTLPENNSASFELDIDKNGQLHLSDFIVNGQKTGKKIITSAFRDSTMTPAGVVVITPSAFYNAGTPAHFVVEKIPIGAARGSFSGRLGVAMSGEKSSIIRITMSDESTERADNVISTLIDVYNEAWVRDKNLNSVATSNFINERLAVIERELGNVESDISSFKSENLVPDINQASSAYFTQNQQQSAQLLEFNNQLLLMRMVRDRIANDHDSHELLPFNSGIGNSGIEGQITEYNTLMLQRNNLAEKSSESNPLVKSLDDDLKSLRNVMIGSIDNAIVTLNSQIRSLQNTIAYTTSRIATSPSQAKYLLSVERQQKVKESLYLFLLQKREENELSQAFTAYNTRLLNRPGGAGVPVRPNRSQILMIAFLIGLTIPFGVTFAIESVNTRVRGRKDIEHLTIPFLGEIPMVEGRKATRKDLKQNKEISSLSVAANKRNVINEAFRVLRTNVDFMTSAHRGDGANVIAITSFNPHSGKSFITLNLGATLALKNKRVLVIDGDMRHGSSSSYIGKPSRGLSNYLCGAESDPRSLIVQDPNIENLNILPIGTTPPNPTELLESPLFPQLLETLKNDYDYILIDCPPIEIVADTQIIDRYVDRTIFIIRAGLLERSMLPELEKLYINRKYRNMAVILNGTTNTTSRYGYRHSYRYGYGYGYGYGYHYGNKDDK